MEGKTRAFPPDAKEIDMANLINMFGGLELEAPQDGRGRFDCVWCTISALSGVPLIDLQLLLPSEKKPSTIRGIVWDDEQYTGLFPHQVERLLAALDKNVLSATRMELEDEMDKDKFSRIKAFWDLKDAQITEVMAQKFAETAGVSQIGLSYKINGIGHCVVYRYLPDELTWEFVDWQADPTNGKVFELPQGACIFFLFAILPRVKEYFDSTWTLKRVENGQLIKVLHEKRDQVLSDRRKAIREVYLKETRGLAFNTPGGMSVLGRND